MRGYSIEAKTKALAIANAASDKKAFDIVFIDMRKMSNVCDYFVILSASSTTHGRAIADHIREKLRERREGAYHLEGAKEASWILLDFGDVVTHIFLEPMRRFYDLERLWQDAPQSRFKEKPRVARKTKRASGAKKKKSARAKR